MKDPEKRNLLIRQEAQRLGFLECGITNAGPLENDSAPLVDWIRKGYHGGMRYMEENQDLRLQPEKHLPGARSVIMVLQNYFPSNKQQDPDAPVVARYAFGPDYHTIIKKKLKRLLAFIQKEIQPCQGKIFVDSSPVLEKALAHRAGLGWTGKNTLLITKDSGSYFFIGGIITDLELEYNHKQVKDHCGACDLCLKACPTGSIVQPHILDTRKCISFLTIENRDCGLPPELKKNFRNRVFGCDICQEVCPWNHRVIPHTEKGLNANPELLSLTRKDWYNLDETKFRRIFTGTPLERLKYQGLRRNLEFLR